MPISPLLHGVITMHYCCFFYRVLWRNPRLTTLQRRKEMHRDTRQFDKHVLEVKTPLLLWESILLCVCIKIDILNGLTMRIFQTKLLSQVFALFPCQDIRVPPCKVTHSHGRRTKMAH